MGRMARGAGSSSCESLSNSPKVIQGLSIKINGMKQTSKPWITWQVISISSCPVMKTRISPGGSDK